MELLSGNPLPNDSLSFKGAFLEKNPIALKIPLTSPKGTESQSLGGPFESWHGVSPIGPFSCGSGSVGKEGLNGDRNPIWPAEARNGFLMDGVFKAMKAFSQKIPFPNDSL